MAIELVVTAEVSAANSNIEVIDAANIEASGELVFHIIPVRHTLLSCVVSVVSLRICAHRRV